MDKAFKNAKDSIVALIISAAISSHLHIICINALNSL